MSSLVSNQCHTEHASFFLTRAYYVTYLLSNYHQTCCGEFPGQNIRNFDDMITMISASSFGHWSRSIFELSHPLLNLNEIWHMDQSCRFGFKFGQKV